MGKVFIIDVEKCNGCYDCLIACNDENFREDLQDFDMLHPALGQFLMKVEEHYYGDLPRIKQYFLIKPCMQCRNAPCMQCCPVDAIQIDENGLVELIDDKCISCRMCVYACPYDSIYIDRFHSRIRKCSGCSELVKEGKDPRCVASCERNAIIFGDEAELKPLIEQAESIIAEEGMKPRVYYINVPGSE